MLLKNNLVLKILKKIILILINIGIISSIFPIHTLNSSILAATNNVIYVHNLSELNDAIINSQDNSVIVIKNNIYIDEEYEPQSSNYSFDFDENNESDNENFLFTVNNKQITIKGDYPSITITSKNSMGFFKCENNANLILDNIILDGGENFKSQTFSTENSKDIESSTNFKKMSKYLKNQNIIRCNENCNLTMSNCTIQNCCTLNNSLICISGSNAYLNENNKIFGCACYQSSPIHLMASENQLLSDTKSHAKIEDISLEDCVIAGDNIATAVTADEMSYLIIKNIVTNNCFNIGSNINTINIFNNSKCFFYDETATEITICNESGYIRTLKKYQTSDNLRIINNNNLAKTEFVNKITFDYTNETKNEIEPIYLSDDECMSDLKIGPLGSFYTASIQGGTENYKIPIPTKSTHKFIEWMCDNNTKLTYTTKFKQDTKLTALWTNENDNKITLDSIEKTDENNPISIEYSSESLIESNTDVTLTYTVDNSTIITDTCEMSLDGGNNFHNINNTDEIKIIETTPKKLKFQLHKDRNYSVKIKAIDTDNNCIESDVSPLINIRKSTDSVMNNSKLRNLKRNVSPKILPSEDIEPVIMQFYNLSLTYIYGDDPFTISVIGCGETNNIIFTSNNPDVATIDSTGKITIHKTGQFKITAQQIDNNNNEISSLTSDIITIYPRPVTIDNITVNNKFYDGNDSTVLDATSAYIKGKLLTDDLTFKIGSANFENKNVGKNKIVNFSNFELLGKQKNNYILISQPNSVMANILPKCIEITNIIIEDKIFDGTNIANFNGIPTLNGVIEGDDVSLIHGTPTFSRTYIGKNIPINFTYFSLIGRDCFNYSLIHPTNITGNIIPTNEHNNNYLNIVTINDKNQNPINNTNKKLQNTDSIYTNNSNYTPTDSDYISTDDESSSNNDIFSETAFNQKDNKTGIWVCAPAGVFTNKTKLFIKELEKTSSEFSHLYNKINYDKKQSINDTQLFKIHVENEKHEIVNPNISKGSITIRIPIPNSYDPDKFKIYEFYGNSENEINKQFVKINEQCYYEFKTNNFTPYATINEQTSTSFINVVSISPIISVFAIVLIKILIRLKHGKI